MQMQEFDLVEEKNDDFKKFEYLPAFENLVKLQKGELIDYPFSKLHVKQIGTAKPSVRSQEKLKQFHTVSSRKKERSRINMSLPS